MKMGLKRKLERIINKTEEDRPEVMGHWLRAPGSFPKDPGPIPSSYVVAYNYV